MDIIFIYYKSNSIMIDRRFAELEKIKEGYQIQTEDEFWQILRSHAKHQISKLNLLIDSEKSEKQN